MAINPIQLQKFLHGMDYPADKRQLVEKAQSNGADKDTVKALQRMDGEQYLSPAEVSVAMFGH